MRLTAFFGAFVFFLALPAGAQDVPLPKPETQDPLPAQVAAPNLTPSPSPALIPPDVLSAADRAASPFSAAPAASDVRQLDESFKETPLSVASENARRHTEWRELQNRVANNGEIKAALHLAEAARTDLEKRKLLENYYEIYFGKMTALAEAPDMKNYLNDRKKETLAGLAQPRVRPSPPTRTKPGA